MSHRHLLVRFLAPLVLAAPSLASQSEAPPAERQRSQRQQRVERETRQAQRRAAPRYEERRPAERAAPAQRGAPRPPPVGAAPFVPGRLGIVLTPAESGGVRAEEVLAQSAAEAAGLRAGDVLIGLEGRTLGGAGDLVDGVRARAAGTEVKLRVRRTLRVDLDAQRRTEDGRFALGAYLGAGGDELVVTQLREDFPGAAAGLRVGDRIVSVEGVRVEREPELAERMRSLDGPRPIEIAVERDVKVRLGAGPPPQPPPPPASSPQAPLQPRTASGSDAQIQALRRELAALREELALLRRELQRRDGR